MGQRISIQYSIDIDDLPDEANRLLLAATQQLNKLSDSNIREPISLGGLQDIDSLRRGLANVDAALQDLSVIVGGYLSYKASEVVSQSAPPDVEDHQQEKVFVNEESTDDQYSF
jgi:hypothetical protein